MSKDVYDSDNIISPYQSAGADYDYGVKSTPRGKWVMPKMPKMPTEPGTYTNGVFNPVLYKDDAGRIHRLRAIPSRDSKLFKRNAPLYEEHVRNFFDELDAYRAMTGDPSKITDRDREKINKSYRWQHYQEKLQAWQKAYMNWQQRVNAAAAKRAERRAAADERRKKREEREYRRQNKHKFNGVNYTGWTPWNPKYGEFKALTEDQYTDIGANYKDIVEPKKKTITTARGEKIEVIDGDLYYPLGFSTLYGYGNRSAAITEDGITSTEYAEEAFSGKYELKEWHGTNAGHITDLVYCDAAKVLKVTFREGGTFIYFRVPSVVAEELISLGESGYTQFVTRRKKQVERHTLGIRFWDLIRIRGTRLGSRYRYEYVDGSYTESQPIAHAPDYTKTPEPAKNYELTEDYMKKNKQYYGKQELALYDAINKYMEEHKGKRPDKNAFIDLYREVNASNEKYDKETGTYTNIVHNNKILREFNSLLEELKEDEED